MRATIVAIALSCTAVSAGEAVAGRLEAENVPIWSGVYAGASLSIGRGASDASEVNGPRNYVADLDALFGSVHIGWQRQWARLVGGIELEGGYLGMGGNVTRDVTGGTITSGADLGAYAALSGRMGVLLSPSLLVYGRAGVIAAELNGKTTQTCDATLCNGAQTTSVSEATTKSPTWGVLLGAGLEQKFNDRWSGRLEYKYMDFRKELALPANDGPGWNQHVDMHALSIGLSYRF